VKTSLALPAVVAVLAACSGGGGGSGPLPGPHSTATPTVPKIAHVVIIFQENRTPDNLFHGLAGADIANTGAWPQGQTIPLAPVAITAPYDLDHSHPGFVTDYASGRINGFHPLGTTGCVAGCPPTAYGYVPPSEVAPYFALAEKYTFGDRMFQTNEGPSFPAHQFIIAGTSEPSIGSDLLASENPVVPKGGTMAGCTSTVGVSVQLIDAAGNENHTMFPCFEHATLGDLLDAARLTWKYYTPTGAGIWVGPNAISHERNGADWSDVSIPNTNVFTDISAGTLPAVSWVIPTAAESDHAKSTDGTGPAWVASVVNAIGTSKYWSSTAIFVTWDDWGGWYDHVTPPIRGSYELGFRVPLIVVSPYAKTAYVSHVQHDYGSILHFVEEQFGLPSLGFADAQADDLADCFNFSQAPIVFRTIPEQHDAAYFKRIPNDTRDVDDQ